MGYRSIYGTHLGSDPADSNKIIAKQGLRTPDLKVGVLGSEVSISGANSVTTPTTAVTIAAGGTSIFPATAAKTYTLAAPIPGVRKTLVATGTSTLGRTINVTGAFTSTAITTGAVILFNGLGQVVELIGTSTANYHVIENIGATLT